MSRQALLLLPGLMCDRTLWEAQIEALSPVADCIVPGYGDLDSLTAMAEAVLRTAPPRFAVAAHSMGGRVALEIVRAAGPRITHLALMDTGWRARPAGEAAEAEARQRLVEMAYASGMRAMGREWVRGMLHPDHLRDAVLVESILAMIERMTPQTHEAQIRALLERPEAGDVLTTIACPTLVLCGRQDAWSPLARHEELAALIRGSRLEVIEHSGHMTPMEQPAAVSASLLRWLHSVS